MATQPSSQFAALLRQSKFASFDPAIAQAYTSYGGHAYRGNFGFKRPLPVRHRNATVFVHAVDSRQQQTEWKSAEQQRRWIQMWDEVGATPHVRGGSTWSNKLGPLGEIRWQVDSEFGSSDSGVDDRGVGAALTGKSTAVANINAMPEREFERYLEKLRKMRPAFREYLKKHLEKEGRGSVPTTLWEQSIKPRTDEYLKDFRATQAYEEYKSPTATSIEQQPQKSPDVDGSSRSCGTATGLPITSLNSPA
ncbi:hypothetical protein SCP_0402340 [Sparassis crispa]|uniref:Uncharacterized protein n=1 Tax=Sparassis crispa TaxID=139825 RepID=A0A401GI39_9APHY|nr:hypothetical protein SCP_0402340 [Sparassis crispa]GBE81860.1 hypothetical protein SCP_0402340 [Sparassis crispa]